MKKLLILVLFLSACGDMTEDPTMINQIGQIFFLNFEPVTVWVSSWEEDATENISSAARVYTDELSLTVEPYENLEGQVLILNYLKEIYKPYNISFVTERPRPHEHITEYSMVIIGYVDRKYLGISPIDCGNKNKKNISYMHKALYDTDPYKIAMVAAHEIGHAVGLWHDTGDNSIMNSKKIGNKFSTEPYVEERVTTRCTDSDYQNAPEILEKNLGLRK